MRKRNYGMQNKRRSKRKMISKGKESIKKMKRRGRKGKKIEGKGKRERKHLLPLRMLRNWDSILVKEVHLNLKMIKRKNRKLKKLRKRLKKKKKKNSQKNNIRPRKNTNNKILGKTIKDNLVKINKMRNLQSLMKIMNKIKNVKYLNQEKKEEVVDQMKIDRMKMENLEMKDEAEVEGGIKSQIDKIIKNLMKKFVEDKSDRIQSCHPLALRSFRKSPPLLSMAAPRLSWTFLAPFPFMDATTFMYFAVITMCMKLSLKIIMANSTFTRTTR